MDDVVLHAAAGTYVKALVHTIVPGQIHLIYFIDAPAADISAETLFDFLRCNHLLTPFPPLSKYYTINVAKLQYILKNKFCYTSYNV